MIRSFKDRRLRKRCLDQATDSPQVIMEKMVTASHEAVLRGKGKIKMSAAETLAIVKQMEELSRTRSILPFVATIHGISYSF